RRGHGEGAALARDDPARPHAYLQRLAGPDLLQAALAERPALPVHLDEDRGGGEPRRGHRRRAAGRCRRRLRSAAAGRLLLRPDGADLVGPVRRRRARRGARHRRRRGRAWCQPAHGGAGMSRLQHVLAALAVVVSAAGLAVALVDASAAELPAITLFLGLGVVSALRLRLFWSLWLDGALALFGAAALVLVLPLAATPAPLAYWLALAAAWILVWLFVERLTRALRRGEFRGRVFDLLIPVLFGAAILVVWEAVTRAGGVPSVLLPPPSSIWARIGASLAVLWADF